MVLSYLGEGSAIIAAMCYETLSHANMYDNNEAYAQWICLLPAVDVVGKHKTIQFTVTCVMITIVQKIVILRSILDHGRSFSCILSSCFFHQSSHPYLATTTTNIVIVLTVEVPG
jgi:hypothetical protein